MGRKVDPLQSSAVHSGHSDRYTEPGARTGQLTVLVDQAAAGSFSRRDLSMQTTGASSLFKGVKDKMAFENYVYPSLVAGYCSVIHVFACLIQLQKPSSGCTGHYNLGFEQS